MSLPKKIRVRLIVADDIPEIEEDNIYNFIDLDDCQNFEYEYTYKYTSNRK